VHAGSDVLDDLGEETSSPQPPPLPKCNGEPGRRRAPAAARVAQSGDGLLVGLGLRRHVEHGMLQPDLRRLAGRLHEPAEVTLAMNPRPRLFGDGAVMVDADVDRLEACAFRSGEVSALMRGAAFATALPARSRLVCHEHGLVAQCCGPVAQHRGPRALRPGQRTGVIDVDALVDAPKILAPDRRAQEVVVEADIEYLAA
jgi:hypothetical protein